MYDSNLNVRRGSEETIHRYTDQLAGKSAVSRNMAVAGLMKLYGPLRDATPEERAEAAKAFADFAGAQDTSKLAIAYGLGIIQGRADGQFQPQEAITYAEAIVLLARLGK